MAKCQQCPDQVHPLKEALGGILCNPCAAANYDTVRPTLKIKAPSVAMPAAPVPKKPTTDHAAVAAAIRKATAAAAAALREAEAKAATDPDAKRLRELRAEGLSLGAAIERIEKERS